MEIVLVGNGRSLVGRPGFGATVDRFDRVLRFNNFCTKGFELCVGARTDWWARNEMDEVPPRREPFERVIIRPRVETEECYHRTAAEVRDELTRSQPQAEVEQVERDVFLQLKHRYGFAGSPLTGTLVVAHLLQRYPRVHVCGFDGLAGHEDDLRHYYSEENVIGDWGQFHEYERDARYLYDQVRVGRVVIL